MVHNYRDVEQDKICGKRTVVVLFGKNFGRHAYLWLGIIGALIATATMMIHCRETIVTILLLYLILHAMTYHKMCRMEGKALNKVLGETARNIFIFGLLCSVFLYFT
jgi:1,4-dihydroxy-2-naphthoate octaprenyltransferase